MTIDLPPLRARREDIPLLFHSFVNQAAVRLNRVPPPVKDPAIRELLAHNWPGNVREQRNEAERYVLGLRTASGAEIADGPMSLTRAVETFERGVIIEALRRRDGNITRTAEAIQLPKTTLFGKIRKYDIPLYTKECRAAVCHFHSCSRPAFLGGPAPPSIAELPNRVLATRAVRRFERALEAMF